MKHLIAFLFLSFALCAGAASPIVFKGDEAALEGIYVMELATGKCLKSYNAEKAFTPASVTKCLTAASAVRMLGKDSPFTTAVTLHGEIVDGVLSGNVVVHGCGDPTLESGSFPSNKGFVNDIVAWVRQQGIDSIAGEVLVDNGGFPEIGVSPYWLLEDIAWEYGAGLYGLNYKDNSFSMRLYPGDGSTGVDTTPAVPGLEVVNSLHSGSKGDVMAMRGEGSYILNVYGTVRGESYASRYSMPYPDFVLRDEIVDALGSAGIGCGNEFMEVKGNGITPLRHKSPLRDEILRVMMLKSNNLFAEGMLRSLSSAKGLHTADAALEVQSDYWKGEGVDFSSIKVCDGSGLARTNRFTPKFLGDILAKMSSDKDYVSLFPLAGKEGTVRSLLADTRLAGRLALKSGSMNGVLCYAGYKLDASRRPTHVVVIMVNGFNCRAADVRVAIRKYLLTLF